jgi:hypothetical protein
MNDGSLDLKGMISKIKQDQRSKMRHRTFWIAALGELRPSCSPITYWKELIHHDISTSGQGPRATASLKSFQQVPLMLCIQWTWTFTFVYAPLSLTLITASILWQSKIFSIAIMARQLPLSTLGCLVCSPKRTKGSHYLPM